MKTKEKLSNSKVKSDRLKVEGSRLQKISIKLFIGLLIPVVLLAVYGAISYKRSEAVIINNYISGTVDTLSATCDFLDYGMNVVKQKSLELQMNSSVESFYDLDEDTDAISKIKIMDGLDKDLVVTASTNSFISAIHIFGANGKAVSTEGDVKEDLYTAFIGTDTGRKFEEKSTVYQWVSEHTEIDDIISAGTGSYNSGEYALSIIRKKSVNNGFVVFDISTQNIKDMFTRYSIGDDCILGFVTQQGKEILVNTEEKAVFSQLPYFQEAIAGTESSGNSYATYLGKEYLCLYEKMEDTGAMICAMVPKDNILKQVENIKMLNIAFVSIGCILAIITVTIIAGGISKAVNALKKSILLASEGDLTTDFSTKRKDEFRSLSQGMIHMLDHIRKLIGEVKEVGSKVTGSAGNLTGTCEQLLMATKDISQTIDNTQQGIIQQANDAEQCLLQMNKLSDQINQVYHSTYEIENIADSANAIAGEGIVIINELNLKSRETYDITRRVIQRVEAFEKHSKNIGEFIQVINEIATQTNLLSLNASIEAARAGSAGLGFAVVAEEIRKLADQSLSASGHIQAKVNEIQKDTKDTVEVAKQAEDTVGSQAKAFDRAVEVFNNINNHVKDLVSHLDKISLGMKQIDTAKDDTLLSIESISAVSEESAAASEEMNATALNQLNAVEELRSSALELENDAKKLEEAIRVFKI